MGHPLRVQRSRQVKNACPPGTVYVGRPTKFGNPFVGERALAAYWTWVTGYQTADELARQFGCKMPRVPGLNSAEWVKMHLSLLRGKYLSCWCPLDQSCHADVLCELANK